MRNEVFAKALYEFEYLIRPGEKVSWDRLSEFNRCSYFATAESMQSSNGPQNAEVVYENWVKVCQAKGWRYGKIYDAERKISPWLLEFQELPPDIQLTVKLSEAMAKAISSIQGSRLTLNEIIEILKDIIEVYGEMLKCDISFWKGDEFLSRIVEFTKKCNSNPPDILHLLSRTGSIFDKLPTLVCENDLEEAEVPSLIHVILAGAAALVPCSHETGV